MRPDFGCGIHELVFEVVDTSDADARGDRRARGADQYEARIEVLGVAVDPLDAAEGKLQVEIDYRVRRTNQIGNLVYPFYFREGGRRTSNLGGR